MSELFDTMLARIAALTEERDVLRVRLKAAEQRAEHWRESRRAAMAGTDELTAQRDELRKERDQLRLELDELRAACGVTGR
jgi:uncharacterized coiled-coil DUF342 family protein